MSFHLNEEDQIFDDQISRPTQGSHKKNKYSSVNYNNATQPEYDDNMLEDNSYLIEENINSALTPRNTA